MHVLLTRRSHRFGLPLQCLLWICFGILAVVPWRHLLGQEASEPIAQHGLEQTPQAVATADNGDGTPAEPQEVRPKPTKKSASLIFRGQNAPLEADPFTAASGPNAPGTPGPYNLSPLPQGGQSTPEGIFADDRFTGRSGEAFGYQVRMSGYTGPAIGREHPIFPFELMPYAFLDNNLFFVDVRGFTDTRNGFGGNFGGGYRRYLPGLDRIFGFNAYYDYDNTSGSLFREVGFGVESLGALFDLRANAYFPTGNTRALMDILNIQGTQAFAGHRLLVDQQSTFLNALTGFDSEIGIPLPGRVMERHDVRVFGGGYWFEGQEVKAFGGWKARIQSNPIPSIQLNLQVSNDQQFKTNVVFGATWTFGGFRQAPEERKSQFGRMTTPVQRQYNMVVGQTHELKTGVAVINPATNLPYFFEHVDSNAAGPGDGTVNNPFKSFTVAQAAASPNDIIFVHHDSVFNGIAVALQSDVRVLGESANVDHLVNTGIQNNETQFGNTLLLPHTTDSTTAAKPMFLNSPGVGVTLANNSEFSGFQVGNSAVAGTGPAGIGILGDSVRDVVVRQTDVSFSGGEGVLLTNTAGTISFLGDTINTPASNATTFRVASTTGTVNVGSDSVLLSNLTNSSGQPIAKATTINNITGAGGSALVVEGTTVGSVVNFTGSTINDVNDQSGNAVLIRNNGGAVTLGDATITNGIGVGINFLDNSGTMTGNGTYKIDGSGGDAINIRGLTSTGRVSFTDPGGLTPATIAITNRQARGINLFDNAGNVTFSTPVSIAAAGASTFAAIEYQGSSGNVTFNPPGGGANSIDITNGGTAVLIGTAAVDGLGNPIINTGAFSVNGPTHILNPADIAIKIFNDHSTVTFNGGPTNLTVPMIEQRQNIGIQVTENHGTVVFNNISTISNDNATPTNLPALDIRRNSDLTSSVTFGALNVLDPLGPAAAGFGGTAVNIGGPGIDANPANVTFNVLQITGNQTTNAQSVALFAQNVGQVSSTFGQSTGLTILGTTVLNPVAAALSTISVTSAQAVNISNSVLNVKFNSISDLNSNGPAIALTNNQAFPLALPTTNDSILTNYMFQVLGINGATLRAGGNITGSAGDAVVITQSGAFAQTGAVNLNQMVFTQNGTVTDGVGVSATGLLHLTVTNSEFTQNTGGGIFASNVPAIDIQTSLFSQNGTTLASGGNAIHLTATEPLPSTNQLAVGINPTAGKYLWNIVNNNTQFAGNTAGFIGSPIIGNLVQVDSNGQTIKVQNSPSQQTATPLVFNFNNNEVTTASGVSGALSTALAVNWTGVESGNINQNTFNLNGFANGISIVNSDPTRYTTVTTDYSILGNAFNGNNGGNTGIIVNNFGPTELDIISFLDTTTNTAIPNTFTFTTPTNGLVNTGDVAMRFTVLNSTSNVSSLLNIQNNQITMTGANNEQGIIFQQIQAPATVILSGNNISVDTRPNAPVIGQGINFQNIIGTILLQGDVNNIVTVNGFNTVPNTGGVTTADWVVLPAASNTRTGSFIVNGFVVQ